MMKNDLKAVSLLEKLKDANVPKLGEVRPNYSERYAAAYLGISRRMFQRIVAMLKIEYDVDKYESALSEDPVYKGRASGRYSYSLVEKLRKKLEKCENYKKKV